MGVVGDTVGDLMIYNNLIKCVISINSSKFDSCVSIGYNLLRDRREERGWSNSNSRVPSRGESRLCGPLGIR